MPVCKFFVQGSCRYGERCWNEHPRGGQGGGRQTYDDRRQAQGGGRQTYDDRRQAQGGGRQTYDDRRQAQGGGRQTYDDRRQAPWGNEKREQHSRQPRYDEGGYYQNRNRQQQYYHGDNYNSHQQNYYEDPGSRRNDSKSDPSNKFNKYHWNRENRFGALQEEPKSETSPEIIISTIQKDIKVWIESKMWPYSCYSYTRGARCIEGLADISPEEIRVLAYLHQSQYGTVIEEINRTYNRTKEELFEMSQSVKSDILSNLNSPIESNPSSDLKILELYGPQFNFESDSKAEPAQEPLQQSFSFITEQAKSNAATAIPSGSFNSNSGAFGAAAAPPAATQKPVCSPVANSISVFGVKNTEKNSPFASGKDSGVYTPYDLLTEGEKKQFEADRFIAGQIPTRPPSEQFCQ